MFLTSLIFLEVLFLPRVDFQSNPDIVRRSNQKKAIVSVVKVRVSAEEPSKKQTTVDLACRNKPAGSLSI